MHCCLDQVKQKKLSSLALFFKLGLGCLLGVFFVQENALSKTNVYKQVGPDGQVEYSDQPTRESTEVILPQIQVNLPVTTPVPESKTSQPQSDEAQKQDKQEQVTIRISSPIDQQLFISAVKEVPVTLIVEPKLSPTQKIKLLLDNQPYGEPQNTASFILKDLERGAHELKALVLDDQNKILSTSAPVTFHQQRQIIKK